MLLFDTIRLERLLVIFPPILCMEYENVRFTFNKKKNVYRYWQGHGELSPCVWNIYGKIKIFIWKVLSTGLCVAIFKPFFQTMYKVCGFIRKLRSYIYESQLIFWTVRGKERIVHAVIFCINFTFYWQLSMVQRWHIYVLGGMSWDIHFLNGIIQE